MTISSLGAGIEWVERELIVDFDSFALGYGRLVFYAALVVVVLCSLFLIIARSYEDPYEKAMRELDPEKRLEPLVSFFVAVHNEKHLIEDCVNSMLAQTYQNREIFVVNDASNDGTADILEEKFGRNPEIQLINLEINVGKKHALAKAIRMAKGEIFAFTDSDCIWKEDAIERIVAIFENEPDVGAISGHCNARNANTNVLTKMQDVWYERQYRFRKGFESVFRSVSCVSGPLACYRRAAIYNCVQEWENDTFLGQEFRFATDRTMTGFVLGGATLGAADRNWDVVYSRSAQAWTIVPDTPKKIMAQRIRWNKSFIRNLFFTGKFYWRQPILPALYYYIHAFYVFVAPILVMLFIAWLLFQGHFLLLAACFIAFILISTGINLVFAPNNRWQLGPIVNLLYLLTLPWLLFYSIVTIKNMEWSRENVEEG